MEHAIGHSPANIFKMRGIAAEHAAKRDKSPGPVILIFVCIPVGADGEGDFECARHSDDPINYASFIEYPAAAFFQRTDDRVVPFGPDNDDAGARQVGDIGLSDE